MQRTRAIVVSLRTCQSVLVVLLRLRTTSCCRFSRADAAFLSPMSILNGIVRVFAAWPPSASIFLASCIFFSFPLRLALAKTCNVPQKLVLVVSSLVHAHCGLSSSGRQQQRAADDVPKSFTDSNVSSNSCRICCFSDSSGSASRSFFYHISTSKQPSYCQ